MPNYKVNKGKVELKLPMPNKFPQTKTNQENENIALYQISHDLGIFRLQRTMVLP